MKRKTENPDSLDTEVQFGEDFQRQQPLSLKYDPYFDLAEILMEYYGISEVGAAIASEAYAECLWLSYSRDPNFYESALRQGAPSAFTYGNIVPQIDAMLAAGLLTTDGAPETPRDHQRAVMFSENLYSIIKTILTSGEPECWDEQLALIMQFQKPSLRPLDRQLILLDANGNSIPIAKTQRLQRLDDEVSIINSAIDGMSLSHSHFGNLNAYVRRVFKGSFEYGGRLSAYGFSWQDVPSGHRSRINLGVGMAATASFTAMPLDLLYGKAGIEPPTDENSIDACDADLAKLALNVMLTAASATDARNILANSDELLAPNQHSSGPDSLNHAEKVISELERKHVAIASNFYGDAGLRLMRTESDLAIKVILRMIAKGEIALPLDDGLLIGSSSAVAFEEAHSAISQEMGLGRIRFSIIGGK